MRKPVILPFMSALRMTAARNVLASEHVKKYNVSKVQKRRFHQILHGGGGGGGGDPFVWSLLISGALTLYVLRR